MPCKQVCAKVRARLLALLALPGSGADACSTVMRPRPACAIPAAAACL